MVIRRARTVGAPMQVCCAVCIIIHSSVQLYISMCVCMYVYNYTHYCIVIHSSVCATILLCMYVLLYVCMYVLLCMYVCMYYCVCVCVLSLSLLCARARLLSACMYAYARVQACLPHALLFLLLLALCVLYICYPCSHSCKVVLTLFVVSRLRKIYCCYYSCKEAALLYCCLCECVGFSVSYCIHLIYCGSEIGSLDDCLAADVCECECCLCHCYYLSFC